MTIVIDTILPPCVSAPEHFNDDAPMASIAHRQCAGCPMLVDCLYRAVVEVDVSGFVACTTESERASIRRSLGIQVVDQAAQSQYGLARAAGSPVSHEAVLAARAAYPHDTCQQLSERLGCSTSTIKRHLRRARQSDAAGASAELVERRVPTIDDVLDAFDALESAQVA